MPPFNFQRLEAVKTEVDLQETELDEDKKDILDLLSSPDLSDLWQSNGRLIRSHCVDGSIIHIVRTAVHSLHSTSHTTGYTYEIRSTTENDRFEQLGFIGRNGDVSLPGVVQFADFEVRAEYLRDLKEMIVAICSEAPIYNNTESSCEDTTS